jgi:copper homeostasis protein CutC
MPLNDVGRARTPLLLIVLCCAKDDTVDVARSWHMPHAVDRIKKPKRRLMISTLCCARSQVHDQHAALQALKALGVRRVLTSGGSTSAMAVGGLPFGWAFGLRPLALPCPP